MAGSKLKDTVTLRFRDPEVLRKVSDPIHKDLSTAALCDGNLFLSCDESAGIDRLTPDGDGWGGHEHFPIGEMVNLPAGPDGEMDIEGLACDDGWLWVCGSHGLTRGKYDPEGGDSPAEGLENLARIKRDPNRFFLGRFPLVAREGGLEPLALDGERRASHVETRKKSSLLKRWLRDDPHIARFLDLPCKENGFDIEGIAARGLTVWLGLRGPVLLDRGVILEMEMKVTAKGFLKPKKIDGDRRYRKYLLPTQGQGIRDLAREGDDLLILTGTVMAGDGPSEVLRWKNGTLKRKSCAVPPEQVAHVADLPYRGAVDHPEGLSWWDERQGWLVVYDSPAEARLDKAQCSVTADLWSFGG